jgi:hypothetical protein
MTSFMQNHQDGSLPGSPKRYPKRCRARSVLDRQYIIVRE